MSEDRIDSVIDKAAVESEIKFLSIGLDGLSAQIKSFAGVKINLEGSSNFKQLVNANNEFISSLNGVKKSQIDLDEITDRVTKRVAALNGHSKELTQQILLEAKATKEIAAAKLLEEKARIANEAAARKEAAATAKASAKQPNTNIISGSNVNADGTIRDNEALANSIHAVTQAERDEVQTLLASGLPLQQTGTNKKALVQIDKELAASSAALARAESVNAVQIQKNKILTVEGNKLSKEEALNVLGLITPYQQLTKQYNAASLTAKDLAVQFGANSIQAKAAAKEALLLSTQLKSIDSTVGQAQRNVGNYTAGIKQAFSGLRTLANILPGIGIGGLFLLGFDGIKAVIKSIATFNTTVSESVQMVKAFAATSKAVNEEYIRSSTASLTSLELLRSILNDTTKSEKARKDALRDFNAVADEGNKLDLNQIDNLGKINDAISRQITLIEQRALATASEKILADRGEKLLLARENARTKALKQQQNEDAYDIQTSETAKTDVYFKSIQREGEVRGKIAKDAAVKQAQIEFDAAKGIALSNAIGTTRPTKDKTGRADSLLELKDSLDHEFEIYKISQEAKIRLFDAAVKDEKSTYAERLRALSDFVEATQELNARQEAEDIANKERAAQREIQHLQEEKGGKSAAEKARIDANIKITEENLQKDILLIQKTYNDKSIQIEQNGGTTRKAIVKSELDFIVKEYKEAYAEIANSIEKTAKDNSNQNIISKDQQLLKLDKDFQDGKIKNVEAYEAAKKNIEDDAARKELLNDEDRIRSLEEIFGQTLDLDAKFADDEVKLNELKNKKKLEQDKEYAEKAKELVGEVQNAAVAFIEGGFDKQKNAIQDQINIIEDKSKREIDAINASGLAEQDKANRISIINIRAQKEKEQLERRQRQIDQERARFEKALSIITVVQNTAAAITHDLEKNKALIPFDVAIGAAQIAAIIARPIPKFFKGSDNAPVGLGVYGELGRELVIPKSGRAYLSPSVPTLTSFIGGEKIIPHDLTEDILRANNMMHMMERANKKNTVTIDNNFFGEKMYNEMKQFNRKPPVIVQVTPAYETTAHYQQHIKH